MIKMDTIEKCKYGPLDSKVNLKPDFFSGFTSDKRKEILIQEENFYKELTTPFRSGLRIDTYRKNITCSDGIEIPVKIYKPIKINLPLPLIMFFHGGGFITCSIETHDFIPSFIASNAQAIVCSVEYRLAPEYGFPKGLEDCYDATKWMISNERDLNIDFSKLFVCGDSSGGNYAAVLAQLCKERKEFQIAGQILIYPVTDLSGLVEKKAENVYGKIGAGVDFITAYAGINGDLSDHRFSPLLATDLSELPPALFIQAECDPLVDDGLMYAKKLKDFGVNVKWMIYPGMPHAFLLRTYEETFDALHLICDFVKSFSSKKVH